MQDARAEDPNIQILSETLNLDTPSYSEKSRILDKSENSSNNSLSKAIEILNADSTLSNYFTDVFVNAKASNLSIWHRRSLIIAKILGVSLGAISGIPYFNVAKQFGDSELLGNLYGCGITISASTVTSWAFLEIINDIERVTHKHYFFKEKSNKNESAAKKIVYWMGVTIAGIIATTPAAYIGFKYNSDNILWGSVILIAESLINTYALHCIKKNISVFTQRNNPTAKIKSLIIKEMLENLNRFSHMNSSDRINYISNVIALDDNKEEIYSILKKQDITKIFEVFLSIDSQTRNTSKLKSDLTLNLVKLISTTFPLMWSVVLYHTTSSR